MTKLEVAVQEQFAAAKPCEEGQSPVRRTATANGSRSSVVPVVEPPFAKVNTVTPNSPAAQAGLQAGDKVTKFGWVNWTNHERLGKVAHVVQQNENVSVKLAASSCPCVS